MDCKWKESLNSDGQQFHKKKRTITTSRYLTEHQKGIMTYDVQNYAISCDSHNNVEGLNRLNGSKPSA